MLVLGLLAVGCDDGPGAEVSETDGAETSGGPVDPTSIPGNHDNDGESTGTSTGEIGESNTEDSGGSSESSTGAEVPPPPSGGAAFYIDDVAGDSRIVMLRRDPDGTLSELGTYPSGGRGTGGDLDSQSSIVLQGDLLYSVNPGDDTVAVMRVYEDHLSLMDVVESGGVRPTSVAATDTRLYVLNAAGAGSLSGYAVAEDHLEAIPGASVALSGTEDTAAAQVAISPDGGTVVVTERATNQILTYEVLGDGSLVGPVINDAEGMTPFGLQFRADGIFVVTEAFGGDMNPGASTVSSQRVSDGGTLWTFSSAVPNGQTGSCWAEIVRDNFVYVTNTGSNSISAYTMDAKGVLTLFPAGGVVVDQRDGHGPVDMGSSDDGRFLYVLNEDADTIAGYEVADDGALAEVSTLPIQPAGIGLAVR